MVLQQRKFQTRVCQQIIRCTVGTGIQPMWPSEEVKVQKGLWLGLMLKCALWNIFVHDRPVVQSTGWFGTNMLPGDSWAGKCPHDSWIIPLTGSDKQVWTWNYLPDCASPNVMFFCWFWHFRSSERSSRCFPIPKLVNNLTLPTFFVCPLLL